MRGTGLDIQMELLTEVEVGAGVSCSPPRALSLIPSYCHVATWPHGPTSTLFPILFQDSEPGLLDQSMCRQHCLEDLLRARHRPALAPSRGHILFLGTASSLLTYAFAIIYLF